MAAQKIFRGDVILADKTVTDGYVVCHGDRIVRIGSGMPPSQFSNYETIVGSFISPGFVDIHVHGGANADYMDGTEEAVSIVNQSHTSHGTTSIFPTTTTGSYQELDTMVTACETRKANWLPRDGARIAGVHFYGPYFAEDKVGCHAVEGRRDPSPKEFEYFLEKEIVRIATCASELPGAVDFYRYAQAQGCFITCGHSNACWSELQAGFDAGVRHVDHFWCAMSSVSSLRKRFGTPMQAGMEQFVLLNEEMSTEVIADGEHLSKDLLQFAYQMIGIQRLCLVTDANRALDYPPGTYRFGHFETGSLVQSNGKTVRDPDGGLASSMHGMDHMVRTMYQQTSAPLHAVVRMASLTPAELTGISAHYGSLEENKVADILVLNSELEIENVFVAGEKYVSAG